MARLSNQLSHYPERLAHDLHPTLAQKLPKYFS